MQFVSIPGQEEIKKMLIRAADAKQVAHALLFKGPEGSANLAIALAFIAYLNCEDKQSDDSCGKCKNCLRIAKLSHPDVHLLIPTANSEKALANLKKGGKSADNDEDISDSTGKVNSLHLTPEFRNILANEGPYITAQDWHAHLELGSKQLLMPIADARRVRKIPSMAAFEAQRKIVLIWLPEFMNEQSANALLKVLEEPSDDTFFFLVSNEPEQLITTIISRTQGIFIPPFEDAEIARYLQKVYNIEERQAQEISILADGNMNAALKTLQHPSDPFFPFFSQWMRYCFGRKISGIMEFTEEFAKIGRENQKSLMLYACQMIRHAFVFRSGGAPIVKLPAEEKNFTEKFSPFVSVHNIEHIFGLLSTAHFHIERNGSAKMIFLDTSLQLMLHLKR